MSENASELPRGAGRAFVLFLYPALPPNLKFSNIRFVDSSGETLLGDWTSVAVCAKLLQLQGG
jgi:hypothetical protein